MASVGKDSKGWRVRFVMPDGVTKGIRLTGLNKSKAENVGRYIDELISAKGSNGPIDRATSLWLADIGQALHDKLSNAGLIEPREASTLGMFLKAYMLRRSDAKASTVRKWQSAVNHLIEHFGDDRDLRSINTGHGDEFRSYLYGQGNAENTVRRYCGLAKQFFRAAVRRKLIDENPFADQVAAVTGNAAKFHFITRDDTDKLLKACPDLQWRMIVSLTRYGGLRCPSEVLALRWQDIDWQGKRFTVHSSKTEHHEGGASRVVPLFPELAGILTEGFEQAEEGSTFVVTRYRDAMQNLRTTFQKIIKRAGLNVWPKLFQNLRSTRETELADQFPLQAVTSWIGNSQLVASKHYLQLRDEHFDRASSEIVVSVQGEHLDHTGTKTSSVASQVASETREVTRTDKPVKRKNPAKTSVLRGSMDDCAHLRRVGMGAEGLEPPTPSV